MSAIRLFDPCQTAAPGQGIKSVSEVVAAYLAARRLEFDIGAIVDRTIEKLERYLGIFVADFAQIAPDEQRTGLVSECRRNDLHGWLKLHPEWESGFTRQDAVGAVVRRVLPLLRWLFKRRREGQKTIFANTLGKPWTRGVFAKEFRRYADLAGVRKKVSAYCLRHGLTVRLIEAGRSDRQIADVLGQKTTRYIEWYGRTSKSKTAYLNDILDSSGK